MAILRGFPPSNTIQTGIPIPQLIEIEISIKDLSVEEKFRSKVGAEYMKLTNNSWNDCRGICYKSSKHSFAGAVYGFGDNLMVTWLKEVYPGQEGYKYENN